MDALIQNPGKEVPDFCNEDKIEITDDEVSDNLKVSLFIGISEYLSYYCKIIKGKMKRIFVS